MKTRLILRRIHIWLAWVVGVPLLIWTASGLAMALLPIDTVRGKHLVGDPPALALSKPPVPPQIGPRSVVSLSLEPRADGAKWVIKYADGAARLADPATGALLPPLTAADAGAAVRARYTGTSAVVAIDRTSADKPPLELRRSVESWRVSLADGTRLYVDAATGEIVTRRTSLWRFYDLMWGLHILDLDTRENVNNWWLVGFGAVSVLATILALVLLPMTVWRKRRASGGGS